MITKPYVHTLSRQFDVVITRIEAERDPLILRWLRWLKAPLEIDVPPAFGRERGTR
jgi:hypothetical protein